MNAPARPTPLPALLEVRELLEGLLGRDVDGTLGAAPVNPNEPPGAMTGIYVDDQLKLRALILVDLPLACWVGAAIALIPARTAEGSVENGFIAPDLIENTHEVLNVAASLFNADGAAHLRLYQSFVPRETMPADVQKWVLAYVQRLDVTLTVAGYGEGRMSVLVI
ncbi:hypothetical protein GXB85_08920 [Cellulomonas sp. APG4]|uniref:hypothetical protein n=1 Tax=Cellulomonas sp. APG4 TaxID=1538656 RepID=UPI001379B73F|nr:hypothetical protein [Cellulomonas sp. APG4]NCT91068.1 hypothetical protein [Cellulomonas sp. APG4]